MRRFILGDVCSKQRRARANKGTPRFRQCRRPSLHARDLPGVVQITPSRLPCASVTARKWGDRDAAVLFKERKRRMERQSNRMLENKRGNRN